jgi:hypothetical protein
LVSSLLSKMSSPLDAAAERPVLIVRIAALQVPSKRILLRRHNLIKHLADSAIVTSYGGAWISCRRVKMVQSCCVSDAQPHHASCDSHVIRSSHELDLSDTNGSYYLLLPPLAREYYHAYESGSSSSYGRTVFTYA